MIIPANKNEGGLYITFEQPDDRYEEPVAASILLDEQNGLFFDIYEKQVEEARRQLEPIYDFVTSIGSEVDRLNEHFRIINCENLLRFNNQMDFEIVEGAFLIVQNQPVAFESYTSSGEVIGRGYKRPFDIVRFDTFALRAVDDGEGIVPEMEITESVPVMESNVRMNVYNRMALNPRQHKIAFMEIDTPQIRRVS